MGKNRIFTAAGIARIGVLSALSAILYYIPGIPIIPPIYKLDFSTLPVLVGGFTMGPVQALLILLIKDITGIAHSSSMGVGELADFICSGAFAVAATLIFRRMGGVKGAVTGMIAGIVAMLATAMLTNYYILIPFYVNVMSMPVDKIVGMIAKTVPAVDSLGKLILFAVLPFNLLKAVVLSASTLLVYKPLKGLFK